jgi:DNA-binding beta-propeller fold protein YncE
MTRLALAGSACALAAAALPGAAQASTPLAPAGAVFVQSDGLAGNEIVAYARSANGALTEAGSYPTEGLGGQLTGSVVDHTASQGSLAYDRTAGLLLAVNAGSDTVSVFHVEGDKLSLREVVDTAGLFPVSVSALGDQAYVLNAEEGGSIQGYEVTDGLIAPLAGEHRALKLAFGKAGEPEQFTHTPGEVAFTPNGEHLLVTTKADGQSVEVFANEPGRLSQEPVVNAEGSAVPFAVAYGPGEVVLLAEAGPSALASFQLRGGTLTKLGEVPTGEKATCWVVAAGRYYYTSNAGSATVSAFNLGAGGKLTDLGSTPTHAGTVDAAASSNYLYVQGGKEGTVDEFRVSPTGSLTSLGSVKVPGAEGGEGIVAL